MVDNNSSRMPQTATTHPSTQPADSSSAVDIPPSQPAIPDEGSASRIVPTSATLKLKGRTPSHNLTSSSALNNHKGRSIEPETSDAVVDRASISMPPPPKLRKYIMPSLGLHALIVSRSVQQWNLVIQCLSHLRTCQDLLLTGIQ
jgi:hypothetical protein